MILDGASGLMAALLSLRSDLNFGGRKIEPDGDYRCLDG
jgi:hypothetical protein